MYRLARQVSFLVYGLCLLVVSLEASCPDGCRCSGDRIDCPVPEEFFNLLGCDLKKLDRDRLENIHEIKQLCLTQNQLRSINSNLFRSFLDLRKLDLTNNQISTISEQAFERLAELQGLVLFKNNVYDIKNLFKRNTKLTFLNLGSNQITEIGENDFQNLSKLKYLDLTSNQITTINPKAFEPLVSLCYLILQNNKLIDFSVLDFTLKSLRVADFTNNRLERVPKGLPESITDLRFGKNNITKIGKSDLKRISALQLLTLNENQINSIHDNAFNGLDNVKELWLNSNELFTLPTKLPKNLVKLAINSNLISRIERYSFLKSPLIEELTLETNKITEIEPEAFSKLSMLKDLNLQSNQLHTLTTGIFKDLPNLVSLRLANNPIATVQRRAFESLPSLHTLDISYGELESARVQMDLFQEMPNLQEFNLMNSPGLCKSLLDRVRNGQIETTQSVQKIDFRYNILKNLPENIPGIFPKLTTFLLNNNAWHCDSNLLWLKRWLGTPAITFYENKTPACCTPSKLKGKLLRDLSDNEYLRSAAAEYRTDSSRYAEYKPSGNPSLLEKSQLQRARSSRIAFGTNVSVQDSLNQRKRRRSKRRRSRRNKRKHSRQEKKQ
ncbi:slit homolog 3 protein [Octopus bimaculoides]|uniref:LRRCT domain-containing protein n=1 Tax=Octopus bimaculoides TaxID=37653 RepID=A0A0L8GD06_OCTBM|nr:slit homolog 3 protein [Octopus bimaculoides]XP_014782051.1 slit homolog 3 protein [Octopus bimaculoides]|eukprot:XP_014782050.1 PREDICTED: slit homolog 3 protein-like [Octopus bimaculoides]